MISSTGSTQKGILTAPTKIDHQFPSPSAPKESGLKDPPDKGVTNCGAEVTALPIELNVTQQDYGSMNIQTSQPEELKDKGISNPWEAQEGWVYMGHGEWLSVDRTQDEQQPVTQIEQEPKWIRQWLEKNDQDIQTSILVRRLGYPNRWGGTKIEVDSKWNLEEFQQLLGNYWDREVVDWLRYGWPGGRLPTLNPPGLSAKNHKGATEHPAQLARYIEREKTYGAVMGPYNKIPFSTNIGISPLSTRPKKDSQDRRVILDLSFPIGNSGNDGIPKDTYLGLATKTHIPQNR